MKKVRVVKSALRAICRNPMRTFLTTLGIVIGIGAVIALMEIGNGAQEVLSKNIANMGVNTIMIRPGTIMTGGVSVGAGGRANLTEADVIAIRKHCPSVVAASPVVSARGQLVYGGRNWYPYSINGVDASYFSIANWLVADGEAFDDLRVLRGSKVCLIGSTVARELFQGEDPVGKDIRIQNVLFRVIGVLAPKGANMMGMDQDDTVLAPWTAVRARLKGAGQTSISTAGGSSSSTTTTTTSTSDLYTSGTDLYPPSTDSGLPPVRFANVDSITAATRAQADVPQAVKEITDAVRKNHKLDDGAEDDFTIRTMSELSDFLTTSTKTTTNLLLCVAFVSLVVGGVGIMNIMLVSVTERTREIGLRMAVGARKKDILRQFLIESVVICMLGGLIGIVLGHGTSLLLAHLLRWPTATSYSAIVLSFGVSAAVGVIFGYYPAWKAARLDPIEALRYE